MSLRCIINSANKTNEIQISVSTHLFLMLKMVFCHDLVIIFIAKCVFVARNEPHKHESIRLNILYMYIQWYIPFKFHVKWSLVGAKGRLLMIWESNKWYKFISEYNLKHCAFHIRNDFVYFEPAFMFAHSKLLFSAFFRTKHNWWIVFLFFQF